ncbi:maleylpyruvate isomerase N-terminal domain-containing protein [Nocardioides caldifontis]|uniref:maleylpyruvate isomerase N-terminal domain-containing protein n=1 Tax=Nocardioides caldifontis TaxID=2588938 RepID=UPI003083F3A5
MTPRDRPHHPGFLAALERESARFLSVLRDADPDARVPSCPGWEAADPLWHLTGVQWFWGSIVEERRHGCYGRCPRPILRRASTCGPRTGPSATSAGGRRTRR